MNFDLEEKLQALVVAGRINDAIHLVENQLSTYMDTPFSLIIGRDILPLVPKLSYYLDEFIGKLQTKLDLQALYVEMNGFAINYDLWFLDFFGFDFVGSTDDWDWLADFDDEHTSTQRFIITGFEEIQNIYQRHFQQKRGRIERQEEAADICDYAVVLRLQELLRATFQLAQKQNKTWAELPTFVTAHDFELIYRLN